MLRKLRPEQSEIYRCSGCGEPIEIPQPKGLLGRFYHSRCFTAVKRLSYGVLGAEVIS